MPIRISNKRDCQERKGQVPEKRRRSTEIAANRKKTKEKEVSTPTNTFTSKHVVRNHVLHLNDVPKLVFGLFDPIGEKRWSEGWNPNMITAESTISQGAVFTTKNEEGPNTIWVITQLDKKNCRVAYIAVTPTIRVTAIEIRCEPDGASHTKAHVTYAVTALSDDGNRYVDSFSEDHYRNWMMQWEMAINHYLQHGSTMKHHTR